MPVPAMAVGGARLAMQALPWITGALGAAPALGRGDLGGAILGGGLGALSGGSLKGPIGGLSRTAMRRGPGAVQGIVGNIAPNLVDSPLLTTGALRSAMRVAAPIAGVAGAIPLAGAMTGLGQGAANQGLGTGSGIIGYNAVTGEPIVAAGQAVPGGLGQFGGTNMYGSNPYDIIDPNSPFSANRLMQRKQAETNRDNINTIAPTLLKWSEETKRRDLERQLAAAGIRQNIITQAGMLRDANQAGLNQGTNAMQQVGSALTNNYSYS